jgi:hypothetical protein
MDALDELNDITQPPWGAFGRVATLALVSGASKIALKLLNSFSVEGEGALLAAVTSRPRPVGLLTISNHTSTVDDPALLSALVPWSYFLTGARRVWRRRVPSAAPAERRPGRAARRAPPARRQSCTPHPSLG